MYEWNLITGGKVSFVGSTTINSDYGNASLFRSKNFWNGFYVLTYLLMFSFCNVSNTMFCSLFSQLSPYFMICDHENSKGDKYPCCNFRVLQSKNGIQVLCIDLWWTHSQAFKECNEPLAGVIYGQAKGGFELHRCGENCSTWTRKRCYTLWKIGDKIRRALASIVLCYANHVVSHTDMSRMEMTLYLWIQSQDKKMNSIDSRLLLSTWYE